MGNLCPAGKITSGIKIQRLEAKLVSVSADMTPNTLSRCFQGLRYAGSRVEHRPAEYKRGHFRKSSDSSACLTGGPGVRDGRSSKGRLILAVGMGAASDDGGFHKVGEAVDLKIRAQRVDEGLEIIDGLWKGKPYTFAGKHFHVDNMTMLPRPFQDPRIPIWVVGVWEKPKSMQRALAWDGIIPQRYRDWQPFSAEDIRKIRDSIVQQRTGDRPFEIIAGGLTGTGPQVVRPFVEAGATWWVEGDMGSLSLARLRCGRARQSEVDDHFIFTTTLFVPECLDRIDPTRASWARCPPSTPSIVYPDRASNSAEHAKVVNTTRILKFS